MSKIDRDASEDMTNRELNSSHLLSPLAIASPPSSLSRSPALTPLKILQGPNLGGLFSIGQTRAPSNAGDVETDTESLASSLSASRRLRAWSMDSSGTPKSSGLLRLSIKTPSSISEEGAAERTRSVSSDTALPAISPLTSASSTPRNIQYPASKHADALRALSAPSDDEAEDEQSALSQALRIARLTIGAAEEDEPTVKLYTPVLDTPSPPVGARVLSSSAVHAGRKVVARRVSLTNGTAAVPSPPEKAHLTAEQKAIRRRRGSTILAATGEADGTEDDSRSRPAEPICAQPFTPRGTQKSLLKKSGATIKTKKIYAKVIPEVEGNIPYTIPEDWKS